MRTLVAALIAALALHAAGAQEVQPSEASVRQLFEVMHTRTLLDSYIGQMDQTIQASMRQALKDTQLNAEQRQILDDMRGELVGMLKEELDWSSLEPQLIEVYRRTFSAAEVQAMVRFYSSPTGRAVITKLPVAMQQMMQFMQQRVSTLIPKIAQMQKETDAALKRAAQRQTPEQTPAPEPSPQLSPPPSVSPGGQPEPAPPPH